MLWCRRSRRKPNGRNCIAIVAQIMCIERRNHKKCISDKLWIDHSRLSHSASCIFDHLKYRRWEHLSLCVLHSFFLLRASTWLLWLGKQKCFIYYVQIIMEEKRNGQKKNNTYNNSALCSPANRTKKMRKQKKLIQNVADWRNDTHMHIPNAAIVVIRRLFEEYIKMRTCICGHTQFATEKMENNRRKRKKERWSTDTLTRAYMSQHEHTQLESYSEYLCVRSVRIRGSSKRPESKSRWINFFVPEIAIFFFGFSRCFVEF